MLPMKFAEYVETRTKQMGVPRFRFVREECFNEIINGSIPKEIQDLSLYEKELKILFQDYLVTGGIPKVMDEYVRTSNISTLTYKTYVDAVVGDITKWDKKETYLKQVISRVSETLGTPVSWNALRGETDIASHMTVADYVETLSAAFILIYLYRLDSSRNGPAVERDKKIYFHDPFIFHSLRAWAIGGDPYDQTIRFCKDSKLVSGLVEGIVADHLIRWAFGESKQKALFDYSNSLFHWHSEKREVDFVLRMHPKKFCPLELKYQPKIGRQDKQGVIDFYKTGLSTRGVFLSKEELREDRNGVIIPVWLFLLLV
jgi:predicted AAA+ superfamily ATPase